MKKFIATAVLCCSASIFATPSNITWAQNNLENYHNSGNYTTEIKSVAEKAKQQLNYEVQNNKNHKRLAVVIDIDETALSNYNQIAALYTAVSNVGDIPDSKMLKTINNPFSDSAIAPVLSLYKQALKEGVSVFFLTGRYEYDRAGTVRNLKQVGYTKWKQLILRQPNQYHIPAQVYKTAARKKIESNGYDIVVNIGDQYSDLRGGYADNTYKIPNPFYFIP